MLRRTLSLTRLNPRSECFSMLRRVLEAFSIQFNGENEQSEFLDKMTREIVFIGVKSRGSSIGNIT